MKDYLNRELELSKQEDYVEICCHKCGNPISYTVEDYSMEQVFCLNCFDEIFPED